MKLFKKIAIAFLFLFTPQFLKADLNLIERLMFSNKSYAKNIEVNAYILTQEQACEVMCDSSKTPVQMSSKDLYLKNTYLLLKVRNFGKSHAWGVLASSVPSYHLPIKLSIFGLGSSKSDDYNIYFIQLGIIVISPIETDLPEISVKWDELYTK